MHHALRERGYFYASNVLCLSQNYLSDVYAYSRKVHSLPLDVKRTFSRERTYVGQDVGVAEHAYDEKAVSTVRAWDYSRTRFSLSVEENQYPGIDVVQPAYGPFLDDLYERQNVLARGLMAAFEEMLELPAGTFTETFDSKKGDFGTIRLLYYPGMAEVSEEEAAAATDGISPHTDFELFTLMHQDASGLQFIPPEGSEREWVDAPVRPSEFVVIVGDTLERLTNGYLKATPHRVTVTPHARSSIIRFNALAADAVIKPFPQFVSEASPARYSWVTMETHMGTTMRNLAAGRGSWDSATQQSTSANYLYIDGVDHRAL